MSCQRVTLTVHVARVQLNLCHFQVTKCPALADVYAYNKWVKTNPHICGPYSEMNTHYVIRIPLTLSQ
jgi:hypothetical protein